MHLTVLAGEQQFFPAAKFHLQHALIFSRYFQSQGKYDPLRTFFLKLITVHGAGLFAVPTHIVFVAAPINALLNWLLGK